MWDQDCDYETTLLAKMHMSNSSYIKANPFKSTLKYIVFLPSTFFSEDEYLFFCQAEQIQITFFCTNTLCTKDTKVSLKLLPLKLRAFKYLESHSSLERTPRRRAQLPRASFALKSTMYMCILTRFFPVRFLLRVFFSS